MARTQLFASVRKALITARRNLPDAPPIPQRALTRRSALALMAAAAACTPGANEQSVDASTVAIVGGGTSGLVVAWRLALAGVSSEIFESSGRTGGRMYTLRNFTPEGHFCELGGELVDTNHEALIGVCRELGIDMQRLRPEGDLASDLYDFGGKAYTTTDLIEPGAQTGAFVPVAVRIAADQAALLDAAGEWTARALELDAMPLSKYLASLAPSTERWVIDLLAAAYHAEMGIPLEQQSSLNLVDFIGADSTQPFSVYGESDEAWRIAGGNGTLPETLTQRLQSAPLSQRASIHLRHQLAAIAREGAAIRLTFANEQNQPVEKLYSRVVLALPFTRLREVKGLGGLGLPADKMKVINEMGYGVNAKMMVGTSSRPWHGQIAGKNVPLSGTIYSDKGFQLVWDTSAGQPGEGGVLTNFLTGAPAKGEEAAALATLERTLTALSPEMGKALTPKVRASFFWPNHPHTKASYSGSMVGQYTTFTDIAARGELDGHLVFAGEHTSGVSQGFMNGAVDAGERAARELLAAS
jgi:monoamine oxidase